MSKASFIRSRFRENSIFVFIAFGDINIHRQPDRDGKRIQNFISIEVAQN